MVSESHTKQCASEDVGPRRRWTLRSVQRRHCLKGVNCEISHRLDRGTSVRRHWPQMRVDCEIPGEGNETFSIKVCPLEGKSKEGNVLIQLSGFCSLVSSRGITMRFPLTRRWTSFQSWPKGSVFFSSQHARSLAIVVL